MWTIWDRFVEKSGGKKSRATVPLMRNPFGFTAFITNVDRKWESGF